MSDATALVLGGGPDAEREVSLAGARAVAEALRASGRFAVELREVESLTDEQLSQLPGDVVFPVLHGPWGEGGPMQDMLERDGRAYVGSRPSATRLAMDKMATKGLAASLGVPTPPAYLLRADDGACPLPLPVVVKPIHEGSTIGLHVCRDENQWRAAHRMARDSGRPHMIETLIRGREVTVGMVGGEPLPLIEVEAADGLYDYEAKYTRDDTQYIVAPDLPPGLADRLGEMSRRLVEAMGVRHICRIDFMVEHGRDARAARDGVDDGRDARPAGESDTAEPWLLEVNTMPGFTDHSLVPMAARAAKNPMEMPALCERLINLALAERREELSV